MTWTGTRLVFASVKSGRCKPALLSKRSTYPTGEPRLLRLPTTGGPQSTNDEIFLTQGVAANLTTPPLFSFSTSTL